MTNAGWMLTMTLWPIFTLSPSVSVCQTSMLMATTNSLWQTSGQDSMRWNSRSTKVMLSPIFISSVLVSIVNCVPGKWYSLLEIRFELVWLIFGIIEMLYPRTLGEKGVTILEYICYTSCILPPKNRYLNYDLWFSGTALLTENSIIDLPTGVVTFYMDQTYPRTAGRFIMVDK